MDPPWIRGSGGRTLCLGTPLGADGVEDGQFSKEKGTPLPGQRGKDAEADIATDNKGQRVKSRSALLSVTDGLDPLRNDETGSERKIYKL